MTANDIYEKLREPFDINFISWKINNYSGDKRKAMITFHVDARAVQHRLNEVLGIDRWSFSFSELEKDKGAHGELRVCFEDEQVTREDVGYASPIDKDEWYKDAVSDALKRCAVHFGVGHFLYALPNLWIELTEPGQKYLNKEQDEYITNWLTRIINKLEDKGTPTLPADGTAQFNKYQEMIANVKSMEELEAINKEIKHLKESNALVMADLQLNVLRQQAKKKRAEFEKNDDLTESDIEGFEKSLNT